MGIHKLQECHGGLVGINSKRIEDSYAVGSCYGGGVCGINQGELIRCYGDYAGKTICGREEGMALQCAVTKSDMSVTDAWLEMPAEEEQHGTIWTLNRRGLPVFAEDKWFYREAPETKSKTESKIGPETEAITDSKIESKADSIEISTAQELRILADRIQSGDQAAQRQHVILTADIDFHNKVIEPIGTVQNPYRGCFEGNGHKISGFRVVQGQIGYSGFFGFLMNAEVRNLTVEGKVIGGSNTGILCGQNHFSKILCCGSIGESNGYENVGGLCGVNNGLIQACNFYGYVRKVGQKIGKWLVLAALLLELILFSVLMIQAANRQPDIIFLPEELDPTACRTEEVFTTDTTSAQDNSITLQVQQQTTYYMGDTTVVFQTVNPSTSNQTALIELFLPLENESEDSQLLIAKSGAIPPGYRIDSLTWSEELLEDNNLEPGTYLATARISFYNAHTNEKAMVDSSFAITLNVEPAPENREV